VIKELDTFKSLVVGEGTFHQKYSVTKIIMHG